MKKLIKLVLLVPIIFVFGCSSNNTYLKVGAGYKFSETEINYYDGSRNHPISARFELGVEKGNLTYGISHDSQWFQGFPFNNNMEYGKSEIFVDYKFELN